MNGAPHVFSNRSLPSYNAAIMLNIDARHQPLVALLTEQHEQVALIFERQLASDMSAVNTLCMHVEQYRGKMLRPSLVLLTGMAAAGDHGDGATLTEKHRIIAAVVEMIHMMMCSTNRKSVAAAQPSITFGATRPPSCSAIISSPIPFTCVRRSATRR